MTTPARSRVAVVVDSHEGEVTNKRRAVLAHVFTTTTGAMKHVFGGLPGCNHPWYPLVGRKRVKQALQSEWGKLFQGY